MEHLELWTFIKGLQITGLDYEDGADEMTLHLSNGTAIKVKAWAEHADEFGLEVQCLSDARKYSSRL